jgi:hypothetical protein
MLELSSVRFGGTVAPLRLENRRRLPDISRKREIFVERTKKPYLPF